MRLRNCVCAATVVITCAAVSPALAVTTGLPEFSSAPGTISVTNQFSFGLPSQSYTINFSGMIGAVEGAPQLAGQELEFTYTVNGEDFFSPYAFSIGGVDILSGPGLTSGSVVITLPLASFELDEETGFTKFGYGGIFEDFGPRIQPFPEIELQFTLSALPVKEGYFYCGIETDFCEFSNIADLTEIDGNEVLLFDAFEYPEGTITDGVISFATIDGRPRVTPIPVPGGGLLLATAMMALGIARTRRKQAAAVSTR